jgi:hypothetical protein
MASPRVKFTFTFMFNTAARICVWPSVNIDYVTPISPHSVCVNYAYDGEKRSNTLDFNKWSKWDWHMFVLGYYTTQKYIACPVQTHQL